MYDTLLKHELDTVLKGTSPNSLQHNVRTLHEVQGFPVNTEPTTDATSLGEDLIRCLMRYRATSLNLGNDMDTIAQRFLAHPQSSTEDVLTDIAVNLAQTIVLARSIGMRLGIPVEECNEAFIGATLLNQQPESAVKTMMFGLRKPRHPYENICDENP